MKYQTILLLIFTLFSSCKRSPMDAANRILAEDILEKSEGKLKLSKIHSSEILIEGPDIFQVKYFIEVQSVSSTPFWTNQIIGNNNEGNLTTLNLYEDPESVPRPMRGMAEEDLEKTIQINEGEQHPYRAELTIIKTSKGWMHIDKVSIP